MSDTLSKGKKRGNGEGDRDASGRFRPGHKQPGPGNPHVKRLAEYRRAIVEAVSVEDLVSVFQSLVEIALNTDEPARCRIAAATQVLDRLIHRISIENEKALLIDERHDLEFGRIFGGGGG